MEEMDGRRWVERGVGPARTFHHLATGWAPARGEGATGRVTDKERGGKSHGSLSCVRTGAATVTIGADWSPSPPVSLAGCSNPASGRHGSWDFAHAKHGGVSFLRISALSTHRFTWL
jgi:hypothetical protein